MKTINSFLLQHKLKLIALVFLSIIILAYKSVAVICFDFNGASATLTENILCTYPLLYLEGGLGGVSILLSFTIGVGGLLYITIGHIYNCPKEVFSKTFATLKPIPILVFLGIVFIMFVVVVNG